MCVFVLPGQAEGKPFSLEDKFSSYGLLGIGSVLGVVGVAVSFLKQFTKVLG